MRKQFLAVTIGVLLVLSTLAVLQFWQIKPVEATTLFSDGLECPPNTAPSTFTAWTGTSGTPTIQSTTVREGSYAAQGSNGNYIYVDFTQGVTRYARGSVYYTGTLASGKVADVFWFRDNIGLTNLGLVYIVNDGGTYKWALRVMTGAFAYYYSTQQLPSPSTWYYVELQVTVGNPGVYRVYVDGNELTDITQTALDVSSSSGASRLMVLEADGDDGLTFTVDSVVVANAYIGPGGADSTPPSFGTVIANSTLAGNGTQISCTITDNVLVSAWGCAWNNTGTTVNSSKIIVSSSSPVTALFNGTWNATSGNIVWIQFWANDSTNNPAYSTQTYFTLTTQGGFVLPTDNWQYGYCGWNISDVTVANIQSAVSSAITYSGGNGVNVTIMIAQGDWNINETTSGTFPIALTGLASNTWLNIIGSETNTSASTNFVASVTMPSVILRSTNSTSTSQYMFYVSGVANKHIRFCGLSILGMGSDSASSEVQGIRVQSVDGYRIDHCYVDSHSGADIMTWKSKGLIDHTVIDQTYGGPSWGYGIQNAGNFAYDGIWGNLNNMVGLWDFTGGYTYQYGPNYIENCEFYRCRHAYASSQFSFGVIRHCYFGETLSNGMPVVDQHGATSTSGRCIEVYDNVFNTTVHANGIRGGSALIYNNTYIDTVDEITLSNEDYTGREIQNTNDVWIWGGDEAQTIDNQDPTDIVLNSNYTLSARPSYTPYMYPHPWVGSSPEVVIVSVTYPANTTYYDSTISVQFDATGGTIDEYWFNCKNGSSWIYVSNQTGQSGSFTGFVTGTQYTGYFWANNTDGVEGQTTVMFSVSVNAGGTSSLIVNVWWSFYW